MLDKFVAQALIETGTSGDQRRVELTFVDAEGSRQTVSLPKSMASDLALVLESLAADATATGGPRFTKIPKQWAVGHAAHERFVLIKFDDDPPYALGVEEAEGLCDELRQESEDLSRRRQPALQ